MTLYGEQDIVTTKKTMTDNVVSRVQKMLEKKE